MPTSAPYCFTHQTIPIQPSLKDRRANVWPLNETSVFPVQLGIVLLRRKALCVRHRITPRTIYAVPSRALLWRWGDQRYAARFLDAEAFRPLCVQWLAIQATWGIGPSIGEPPAGYCIGSTDVLSVAILESSSREDKMPNWRSSLSCGLQPTGLVTSSLSLDYCDNRILGRYPTINPPYKFLVALDLPVPDLWPSSDRRND
jgi:hypothetical protein